MIGIIIRTMAWTALMVALGFLGFMRASQGYFGRPVQETANRWIGNPDPAPAGAQISATAQEEPQEAPPQDPGQGLLDEEEASRIAQAAQDADKATRALRAALEPEAGVEDERPDRRKDAARLKTLERVLAIYAQEGE